MLNEKRLHFRLTYFRLTYVAQKLPCLSCLILTIFPLSLVTVPEVFPIVNSIQFLSRFDSGAFVPTLGQWERLVNCSYKERALRILETWLSPTDLHPSILQSMVTKAYSHNFQHEAIAPLVKLNDQYYVHELFHGPTASFKDLALQLTPHFFSEGICRRSTSDGPDKFLILVATSGDTGSAVLEGFKGMYD